MHATRRATKIDGTWSWIELLEEANCPSRVKAAGRQSDVGRKSPLSARVTNDGKPNGLQVSSCRPVEVCTVRQMTVLCILTLIA